MTMFLSLSAGASTLLGAYVLQGIARRRFYVNLPTSALLLALAFGATAGGEFVREGSRKPYTVRRTLYANSITPEELVTLRDVGSVTHDPYPMRGADAMPSDEVIRGALVFRFQCSICHTINGANGVEHLVETWSPDQTRMNLAKLQMTKAFMPPFAGNAEDVEAITQWLQWRLAGEPETWPPAADRARALEDIRTWLAEAGTERVLPRSMQTGQDVR